MKPESLVIVGQPYHGEYVLKLCTRDAMRSSTLVGDLPARNAQAGSPAATVHSVVKRNASLKARAFILRGKVAVSSLNVSLWRWAEVTPRVQEETSMKKLPNV